jgi:hypothetical protein
MRRARIISRIAQVHPGRTQDGAVVDSRVLEEGVVLRRDEGVDDVLGDVLERRELPPLVVEHADGSAVAVEHVARERRAIVRDVLEIREVPDEGQIEGTCAPQPQEAQESDERHQDAYYTRSARPLGSHRLSRGFCDRSRGRAPCATASVGTRSG